MTTVYIATLGFSILIAALFLLNRERKFRPSKALWIVTVWVFISGSRPFSAWLTTFGFAGTSLRIDSPEAYLEGSPIDRALFIALVAAAFVAAALRGRRVGAFIRRNPWLIVFLLYSGASIFWSDYPVVALKRWIKVVGDVLVVMIVLTEVAPMLALKRLLARVGFLLIPLSILFIKYYPDLGRTYNHWTWGPMYTGVTSTKNELGTMCLIFGLGALWQWLAELRQVGSRGGRRRLAAQTCILAMVLWLFSMANSMTSLSCFVMAGCAMVVLSSGRFAGRTWIANLMLLGAAGVSGFALFLDSQGSMISMLGRDPSLTGRTAIWSVVLEVSASPWFGAGFESFWLGERLQYIWDHTMKGLQHAHNGYLEVYLNLGWIGLGLVAALIVAGYRNILKTLRRDRLSGAARLAYFIVAIVYNFTEAGFRETSPVWIFFLLAVSATAPLPAPAGTGAKRGAMPADREWKQGNPAPVDAGARGTVLV